MKEIERKPWVRWLDLACAVLALVNLALQMSYYFQRLGRGAPLEQLEDVRFSCVVSGLATMIWLFDFCAWRMDQKKPMLWLVRLIFLTVLFAGWMATYPLMTASGFSRFFWWLMLAVVLAVAIYTGWKYWSVRRQTRSLTTK